MERFITMYEGYEQYLKYTSFINSLLEKYRGEVNYQEVVLALCHAYGLLKYNSKEISIPACIPRKKVEITYDIILDVVGEDRFYEFSLDNPIDNVINERCKDVIRRRRQLEEIKKASESTLKRKPVDYYFINLQRELNKSPEQFVQWLISTVDEMNKSETNFFWNNSNRIFEVIISTLKGDEEKLKKVLTLLHTTAGTPTLKLREFNIVCKTYNCNNKIKNIFSSKN